MAEYLQIKKKNKTVMLQNLEVYPARDAAVS